MRLLANLIANGLALYLLAKLIPGQVSYHPHGLRVLVIFAIVLAILNTFIRPILRLISLPLTCLTFGLFALIVNAVVFYLAAYLSPNVDITYLGALAGTILVSILSGVISSVFDDQKRRS